VHTRKEQRPRDCFFFLSMYDDYQIIQDTIDDVNYETWQDTIDDTGDTIQDII
jgi:hypothetical protein